MLNQRSLSSFQCCDVPLKAEARSSLSPNEEDRLIARGHAGADDIHLVNMFPGTGTRAFVSGQECWCVTPSLGICQAVLIASCSPGLGGRLSLTHFAPAFWDDHVTALRNLSSLHLSEGYTEHHVVYAYPKKDYEGRYPKPMRSQAELHYAIRSGTTALEAKSEVVLHYSHAVEEDSRAALVGHLVGEGRDAGRLAVDLFGQSPIYVW